MALEMKEIDGFPGYFVTKDGRIFSKRYRKVQSENIKPKERRTTVDSEGYVRVSLYTGDGIRKSVLVHHAVLLAFHGKRPTLRHETRHLDGNKLNNRTINLAWGTPLENAHDRIVHGTTPRGERHPQSWFTRNEVRVIKKLLALGVSISRIKDIFECPYQAVWRIKNGICWSWIDEVNT